MKLGSLSFVLLIFLSLSLNNCATVDTVSSFTNESPKLYSGTRLDWTATSEDELRLRLYEEKFGVLPPDYPRSDLFFSFILDTFVLPVTLPIAMYEIIFE